MPEARVGAPINEASPEATALRSENEDRADAHLAFNIEALVYQPRP